MAPCLFNISFAINEPCEGAAQKSCDLSNTTSHRCTTPGILRSTSTLNGAEMFFTRAKREKRKTLTAAKTLICVRILEIWRQRWIMELSGNTVYLIVCFKKTFIID